MATPLSLLRKLTAAAVIAGLILVVGALSIVTMQALVRASERVDQTDAVIRQLEAVLVSAQNAETGQRGYLLTGDSAYLLPFHSARGQAQNAIDTLRTVTPLAASWTAELDSLAGDIGAKFAELDTTITLFNAPNHAAAIEIVRSNRGRLLMERVRAHVAQLEGVARNARTGDATARANAARTAIVVIVVASLIAFALSMMVNRSIRRDLLARLQADDELARSAAALERQTQILDAELAESQSLAEELEQTTEQLQDALVEAEEGRSGAEAAEGRITTILASLPDAINVFDHDWRWLYLNENAAALWATLGHDHADLLGRVLWDEFPELANTRFSSVVTQALKSGAVAETEEYYKPVDRWFTNRVIPTAETVVAITQDVTARKRAAEDSEFVARLNAMLASAPIELEEVLNAISQFAVPTLADYCSIDVRDADGSVRRVAAVHRDPEKELILRRMWAEYPYDPAADYGSPAVLRSGVPTLVRSMPADQVTAFVRTPEHAKMLTQLNPRSYAAVPIPGPSGPLGIISLVMSDSGRVMTQRSLDLATIVATRAGTAVERATLHRELRTARDAASASASRFEFLARASQTLSSSLDYEITLEHVAHLCVPGLADWCSVEIVEVDGRIRQLVVAHRDPEKAEWARELSRRYPPDANAPAGVPQVIRSGRSEFYPEIPDELLRAGAVDEEHLRLMREIGFTSAMIVPMTARDRIHGAITLVSAESGTRYTAADLVAAEELARRAAIAVDNARLYRAAEQARAEAVSANRAKSDFLATISHEIRTPINAVIGYTQLIEMGLSGPLTAEQRVQIDRIASSTTHLLALVNEVLDLAKVESGTLDVQLERVSVGETVGDALALLRPQAAQRGVALSENCEGEHTAIYLGDAHRVRQVLTNLVANAVKFTRPGGAVTVSCAGAAIPPRAVSADAETAFVAIRVVDTGDGIPSAQLDRIFEPFTQLDSGYTRQKAGTGLGLTISRRLARLMGGEITVESVEHQGSTFTLWLPRSNDGWKPAMLPQVPHADTRAAADRATTRRDEFDRIASILMRQAPGVLAAWRNRLRHAPIAVQASALSDDQLDDHSATYLTDLALLLRVFGATQDLGNDPAGLVSDSKVIMRVIAEQHGLQRQRLGWEESSIATEMRELAEAAIRAIGEDSASLSEEIREAAIIIRESMEQSIRIARAAFRAAVGAERA